MRAKQLAKLIGRGSAAGLTPEQQLSAKSAFLTYLLVGMRVDVPTDRLYAEKSRAKKLDIMIETLKNCEQEVHEDAIKHAHCAMNSPWARACISSCLGYKLEELNQAGIPNGYIPAVAP